MMALWFSIIHTFWQNCRSWVDGRFSIGVVVGDFEGGGAAEIEIYWF